MIGYYNHGVGELAPPEERYIMAKCGHEVYEGEDLYETEDGTLCPDCFDDALYINDALDYDCCTVYGRI